MELVINLQDLSKVKNFISVVNTFESDIDIIRGRYVIDAKSAMGVFTIDLSEPVHIYVHSDDKLELERFSKEMEAFK